MQLYIVYIHIQIYTKGGTHDVENSTSVWACVLNLEKDDQMTAFSDQVCLSQC